MDFEMFATTIKSPALAAVAAHWDVARAGKRMPKWDDLQPSKIAGQLPIVWAYRYDQRTGEFTSRLAGDRITQIFGKNLRNVPLEEVHPKEALSWVYGLYSRIVTEPAIYRSSGRVFKQLDRYGEGERIVLPLSSDDMVGDGILGATEYRYSIPKPGLPCEVVTESEEWFSLAMKR